MPAKPRSIRRRAFQESQYPEVSGTRCIEIKIPDSDEYVFQLMGLLSIATQRFQYENKDVAQAEIVAQQWKDAYLATDWDGCMNCEDVADCIENNEATQSAINNLISAYLEEHGGGSDMQPSEKSRDIASIYNPTCSLDIVWSQCVGIVDRTNEIIEDLLESLTEASTAAAVTDILASLPGVENLGISSLSSLATLLVEVPLASYTDDFTVSWSEELACELFCMARHDCEITFDMFWGILKARVEEEVPAFVPPSDFINILGWATQLQTYVMDLAAVNKADLMFYFVYGGLAYGNVILNQLGVGQRAFEVAMLKAADEPSNDWEVICLECPEYENIVIEANPYTAGVNGLTLSTDGGTFLGGDNRIVNSPNQAEIVFTVDRRIHQVKVIMSQSHETNSKVTINGVDYFFTRGTFHGGFTYEYTATIPDVLTDVLDFQFAIASGFSYIILSGVNSFVINVWQL